MPNIASRRHFHMVIHYYDTILPMPPPLVTPLLRAETLSAIVMPRWSIEMVYYAIVAILILITYEAG